MFPIWNFFLKRRQFTYLFLGALVIAGALSVLAIRKESAPEVQIPIGIVTTVLPGASAEEVEKLITNKIEEQLSGLSGLNRLTSTSREGVSSVVVEFEASAPIKESIQKLKDEVDKAKSDLPAEAEDPFISEVNFVDQPIVIASISTDRPASEFAALGEALESELQGVSGVNRVEIQGVRKREVQVIVRKEDLPRYGVSLNDVANAIRSANASLPVGSVTVDQIEYGVRFAGDLADPKEVANIPIRTQGGVTLYVRDVATVSDGVADASTLTRLSLNGEPSQQALTINVYKAGGADVTVTAKNVREKMSELESTLLAGSSVVISYDTGKLVEKDLRELTQTGIETVILVMLCLLLTIGWRESLIAGIAVPLSFLISFVGLYYSGNTINFVSLFSLILAIGILVDAGIVILEALAVRIARHGDAMRAAEETIREFAWPLIAGTVATIAVFVPLFFISGVVGKFIFSIPFTIITVLIASIFVALGILPILGVLLAAPEKRSRFNKIQDEYAEKAKRYYEEYLRKLFANRTWQNRFFIGIAVAFCIAVALPIVGLVKVEFFPGEAAEFVYVDLEMPEGTPLEQTDLEMRKIEEILYERPEFDSVITTIGAGNAFSGSGGSGSRFGNALILLPEDLQDKSAEVVAWIRDNTANVSSGTIRAGEPAGGPPVGAPILIKLLGTDMVALEQAALDTKRIVEAIEGTTDVRVSGESDGFEFVLAADRSKLAEVGLSPIAVAQTLRTAVFGVEATTIKTLGDDIAIKVRANLNAESTDPHDSAKANLDTLKQVPITTPTGSVLLGSLVTIELKKTNAAISHEDRKRIVTITANLKEGGNAIEALSEYEKAAKEQQLPAGVTREIGGENEETNKSFAEMGIAFIAGIVLMYAVVVLEFNSFRLAAYNLLIVPLSLIGVVAGLLITFNPLSFPSLIGMIALGGVIINHAIILIDAFVSPLRKAHDAHSQVKTLEDYILTAASSRLRPICLTTITTAVGMIPLSLAPGLWAPLAFTIMFGLIFGTVLTLVLIPLLLNRWPGKSLRKMLEEAQSTTQS